MLAAQRLKPNGLPPWARIRRQADFDRAWRHGRRARASALVVVAVANGTERTRLGLSVGKRIWPGAVQRNRLKRVAREAFRLEFDHLPAGVDLVVMAAKPRLVPELSTFRAELRLLANKAWRRYQEAQREREESQPESADPGAQAERGGASES